MRVMSQPQFSAGKRLRKNPRQISRRKRLSAEISAPGTSVQAFPDGGPKAGRIVDVLSMADDICDHLERVLAIHMNSKTHHFANDPSTAETRYIAPASGHGR